MLTIVHFFCVRAYILERKAGRRLAGDRDSTPREAQKRRRASIRGLCAQGNATQAGNIRHDDDLSDGYILHQHSCRNCRGRSCCFHLLDHRRSRLLPSLYHCNSAVGNDVFSRRLSLQLDAESSWQFLELLCRRLFLGPRHSRDGR